MNKKHKILQSEHLALHRTCLQNYSLRVSPLFCVIIHVVFFCGCMDVASQQETIPKLSQMYAFFNLYCGCSTNVVPNSLRLFGSSFLLSFLPFSPSSLTREIILVDVYLIFTQLSFYLPSHYTPQIQAEEITLD